MKLISEMNSMELIELMNGMEEEEFFGRVFDKKYYDDLNDILYYKVLKEYENIKIPTLVKLGKFPTMIYCLTISPPNDVHCTLLVKLVNNIRSWKGCDNNFGVFEVSRKNKDNFHCHVLFQFLNKNVVQDIKKRLEKNKYIYKLDKILNKIQLLKTLRYMLNKDKLNKGIINNNDLDYFYKLCETNQSLISERCRTTECKCECVHNL